MKKQHRIDFDLFLGESLFEGRGLAILEGILRQELPAWSSDLHIWREGDARERREIADFASSIRSVALERGELYRQRAKRYGPYPNERRFGHLELRGANDSLAIFVSLDDHVFAPISGTYSLANSIGMQIYEPLVERFDAAEFVRKFAAAACAEFAPWHAHGEMTKEWDAKNMELERGARAIGGDISRYLPGLYWLNFFGAPYCDLIGKERLLSAPANETVEVDAGVLVCLEEKPETWDSPEYKATENRVLDHLGREYFFDRNNMDRNTKAPDFGLEPLPRHPRFT